MIEQQFINTAPLTLASGNTIERFQLTYHTAGKLNDEKNNVVWIFHALTANSNAADWWSGLVGAGKLFNPEQYFIICVNMPNSCYGSFSPFNTNPTTNESYYHDFPFFTIKDMVHAYQQLKTTLGISNISIGIGGSMGGQQLLEWAITEPQLFKHIIPIATNAVHSPWGKAFNASQRMAITADNTWQQKNAQAGLKGLAVARSVAIISYRHYDSYHATQQDTNATQLENYRSESYQQYQGGKLANRFNAFSYYFLTKAMDAHHVGRNRNSIEKALQTITAKTLVIGINSDFLFPITEQRFLATHIKKARLACIDSIYGHDGFLLEFETIEKIITQFLKN